MENASEHEGTAGGGLRWGVERRLEFLESRLYWDGQVNRADIAERFGVSINQVSADLTRYQALAPENLIYDKRGKCYRTTPAFRPRFFEPDANRYLAQLRLIGDGVITAAEAAVDPPPPFDVAVAPFRAVEAPLLRAVLWAVRDQGALHLLYQSLTRAEPLWRWIEPHALAFDGFRWHARAFCQRDRRFKDFVLARILAVGATRPATVSPEEDADWHSLVTLELAPHPRLTAAQRAVVARDYGMEGETLLLPVRRSLLFYTLRRLRLDLDPDSLPERDRTIVLLNRSAVIPASRGRAPAG